MSQISVLIVEDDIPIAQINQKFVEKVEGFKVTGIATNLEDAREMLTLLQPDLVLLDVYFPDGSGVDLLWFIRQNQLSTDVIMITAAKEIHAVQEAIRGGAIDYIIKPIVFERFQHALLRYKAYRQKIDQVQLVDQEEVDQLLETVGKGRPSSRPAVPKGINPLTLQKVEEVIRQTQSQSITAEELGQRIGVSRTTARRYLEYFVSIGKVQADLAYGTVGRPERRYYLTSPSEKR